MKSIRANLEIINEMTNDEIKEYCKKNLLNGDYVTMVCKGCGMYYCDIDGNTETCNIVNTCNKCFNPINEKNKEKINK